MPTTTPKLGLVKPYESDYYDVNTLNANMDTIDNLTHIVASGTATSTRSQVNAWDTNGGTVTWYWKKYSDGTLEAYARFIITNLRCNAKQDDGTWYSGYIQVNYPDLGQDVIFHRSVSVGCVNAVGIMNWAIDTAKYGTVVDATAFTLVSIAEEPSNIEKCIYVGFKGTWK